MKNENIRITVDCASVEATEFAAYLRQQGYDADVEPVGRHTQGRTVIETTEPLCDIYESEEDFLNELWANYCNNS